MVGRLFPPEIEFVATSPTRWARPRSIPHSPDEAAILSAFGAILI
jgi:hypothetical protein